MGVNEHAVLAWMAADGDYGLVAGATGGIDEVVKFALVMTSPSIETRDVRRNVRGNVRSRG